MPDIKDITFSVKGKSASGLYQRGKQITGFVGLRAELHFMKAIRNFPAAVSQLAVVSVLLDPTYGLPVTHKTVHDGEAGIS